MNVKIDANTKSAIEKALSNEERVEIVPTKDGFLVFSVKRKKIAAINKEPERG